jgi:dCTP deaminase
MAEATSRAGTLTYDDLARLFESGALRSPEPNAAQIQPASIDLTLSEEAYRLPGSVLPLIGERVEDLVRGLALERLDLSTPRSLAREHVYVVRLREACHLPERLGGYTNSKSSAGRVDVATRTLADGGAGYDRVPAGYQGDLWLEIIPRSFNVIAQRGTSLNQAIFFEQRVVLDAAALAERHAAHALLLDDTGARIPRPGQLFDNRVVMTADLSGETVGYVAKRTHKPLDLQAVRAHQLHDFFVPVPAPSDGLLFLEKGNFYIFATRERIWVPGDLACEMLPYEATAGEFRAHYAGFFDPGFGIVSGKVVGARAVLEVRSHQDDLILRHGQPICGMAFEELRGECSRLYGSLGNSYANQFGPKLSKHFSEGP